MLLSAASGILLGNAKQVVSSTLTRLLKYKENKEWLNLLFCTFDLTRYEQFYCEGLKVLSQNLCFKIMWNTNGVDN